jgi:hypothetical protein
MFCMSLLASEGPGLGVGVGVVIGAYVDSRLSNAPPNFPNISRKLLLASCNADGPLFVAGVLGDFAQFDPWPALDAPEPEPRELIEGHELPSEPNEEPIEELIDDPSWPKPDVREGPIEPKEEVSDDPTEPKPEVSDDPKEPRPEVSDDPIEPREEPNEEPSDGPLDPR